MLVLSLDVQSRDATGTQYMAGFQRKLVRKNGKPVRRAGSQNSSNSKISRRINRRPQVNSINFGRTVTAPVIIGSVRQSSNHVRMTDCYDKHLGDGLQMGGSELFRIVRVAGTGASTGAALALSTADTNSVGFAFMGPGYCTSTSGSIYNMAYNFGMYRFTKLIFRYVPHCSTSTAATVTFGYVADVAIPNFGVTPSYQNTASMPYAMETPAWQGAALVVDPVPTLQYGYYTDPGVGTNNARLNVQGAFFAFADNTSDGVNYGAVFIDYEIQLFQRGSNATAAYTVSSSSSQSSSAAAGSKMSYRDVAAGAASASAECKDDCLSVSICSSVDPDPTVQKVSIVGISPSFSLPVNISKIGGSEVTSSTLNAQVVNSNPIPIEISRMGGQAVGARLDINLDGYGGAPAIANPINVCVGAIGMSTEYPYAGQPLPYEGGTCLGVPIAQIAGGVLDVSVVSETDTVSVKPPVNTSSLPNPASASLGAPKLRSALRS